MNLGTKLDAEVGQRQRISRQIVKPGLGLRLVLLMVPYVSGPDYHRCSLHVFLPR